MKTRRIGPRMREVVDYVRRYPGTAMRPVAQYVGPHGSTFYGYRTVWRAVRTGLITAEWQGKHYRLEVPCDTTK